MALLWCIALVQAYCMVSLANSQPNDIFLLAGQSNMAGQGGVVNNKWDGIVPPECHSDPTIRSLCAGLEWDEAREPLHADMDINVTCGVGPGMAFANYLLNRSSSCSGEIGLVPCAISGTKISQWTKGTEAYNQLVSRAMAALEKGGRGSRIRALLWYQGESDTVRRSDAEAYKVRFEQFITDLRADIHSPMLTVIQVALASGGQHYTEIVREAQLQTDLPNVFCIDAKGLPLQRDRLHLTTASQVILGRMLADAFLQTLSESEDKLYHEHITSAFNSI